MRKLVFLALGLIYSFSSLAAEPYHVTDDVKIYMHRGPSNQFKISGRPSAGTPVTVLQRDAGTGYTKIRTERGAVGWIDGRYLKKGQSIKQRLPGAEAALAASQKKQGEQAALIEKLTTELATVKRDSSTELAQINESRAKTTAQVAQLENEIVRLQAEIDGMDETNLMGWFLRGGALAIVGIVIGLIIPNLPKRRRRNDDWF